MDSLRENRCGNGVILDMYSLIINLTWKHNIVLVSTSILVSIQSEKKALYIM